MERRATTLKQVLLTAPKPVVRTTDDGCYISLRFPRSRGVGADALFANAERSDAGDCEWSVWLSVRAGQPEYTITASSPQEARAHLEQEYYKFLEGILGI